MERVKGQCHCGQVQFEAEVDLASGVSCNCSICEMKGSILSFAPADKIQILRGEDKLTDYQFGKKRIHHTFCSHCGISPFGWSTQDDGSKMYAVNLRCVEGVELKKISIREYDGRALLY